MRSPLVGRHNALNLVAAVGCCLCVGISLERALEAVGEVAGVPGRFESVPNERGVLVLVDYAHTPDALDAALQAARAVKRGHLWVVFGCGGNRDQGKRAEMGRVAEGFADRVVVTSDNPRFEDPQHIVDEILSGLVSTPAHVEVDRAAAIRWTLSRANSGDVVLIAGKGHETYQEIEGERRDFDDREIARAALEEAR